VRKRGRLLCWGSGPNYTIEKDLQPVAIPDIERPTHVDVAWDHTCAVGPQGVFCYRRYGSGTKTERVLGRPKQLAQIVVGRKYACTRARSGRIKCWGARFDKPRHFVSVATDQYELCGIERGRGVRCFERSFDEKHTFEPTSFVGMPDAAQIVMGQGFTCVLRKSGEVACWGENQSGQLGTGDIVPRDEPAPVGGIDGKVTQLTAGTFHVCALTDERRVSCWGGNYSAQSGAVPVVSEPTAVVLEEDRQLPDHREQLTARAEAKARAELARQIAAQGTNEPQPSAEQQETQSSAKGHGDPKDPKDRPLDEPEYEPDRKDK
jgi:hypothetical protein